MGNVAAVLIVLAGVFLVIVGIRGTQGAVFGGLFGQSGTTTATIPGTFPNQVQPPSSGGGSSTGGAGGGGGSGVFVK